MAQNQSPRLPLHAYSLANASWLLGEAVHRLWAQKHKELGRFSATLFRLVEAVIDHVGLD